MLILFRENEDVEEDSMGSESDRIADFYYYYSEW